MYGLYWSLWHDKKVRLFVLQRSVIHIQVFECKRISDNERLTTAKCGVEVRICEAWIKITPQKTEAIL